MSFRPAALFITAILISVSSFLTHYARAQEVREYLWYEAENMRGLSTEPRGEPRLNPSWMNLGRDKAPGWGISGPGVSAEWTQGGESEWNSVAAAADETSATLTQEVDVPRANRYALWVRYADWGGRTENFVVRVEQGGREAYRREFGARDALPADDEIISYWGWAFVWGGTGSDAATATAGVPLAKGPARVTISIERPAGARRHVDCLLLTDDLAFRPEGRRKPDFAAARYLRERFARGDDDQGAPLIPPAAGGAAAAMRFSAPAAAPIANRDFVMPWNISTEFWKLYDQPPQARPPYPFHVEADLTEEFVKKYSGAKDVPLFSSKLIVPVIYINDLPALLKEGSAFLRHLRETKVPFAVLINYGTARMSAEEGRAAWKLLDGELREQFIGWISGESIGHVWDDAAGHLKLDAAMSRPQLLDAYRDFYAGALGRKWGATFHQETGPRWDKLIPAQATSSTAYAHALTRWGVRTLGVETSPVQPVTAMRVAFTRGAARQYGANFLYYQAPNFGDTATTFTKVQNFAGPDNFFHSRYGATMGPSLAWYRKTYYLCFMAGASAIYLEQGYDQFFKPGPGDHPLQLNPLGRVTDEFMRFAERHRADRGTAYTPVAFLLDPAHGWDMTDYPHWPLGVSPPGRGDRALRELFGAAYFPAPVLEGEFATAERQSLVSSPFGDVFDVLVAADDESAAAIERYPTVVVGGRVRRWSPAWAARLEKYVRGGGTLFINAAQRDGLGEELTGVRFAKSTAETDRARCAAAGGGQKQPAPTAGGGGELSAAPCDLRGQMFRYERVTVSDAQRKRTRVLVEAANGDPLVTLRESGRGRVIFCALPDLLGLDERLTPFAARALADLFAAAAPLEVSGEVQRSFNRTARGWAVTLLNNRGVDKTQQGMATVDRTASARVTLRPRDRAKRITHAREWTREEKLETDVGAGGVSITLPPGAVRVVEIVEE